MYKKKIVLTDEYKQIFHTFDINKDGFIDKDELRKAVSNLGLELTEEDL